MATGAMGDLHPVDLDLPANFSDWRPIQREAVERVVYSGKRFHALAMPTGSGKSLTAMTVPRITGYRTVIVTGTKGLMDQYMREFGIHPVVSAVTAKLTGQFLTPPGNQLVDIRGKGNYPCSEFPGRFCDDGQRLGCPNWQLESCGYGFHNALSRRSQVVVTNYKYWLTINAAGKGLAPEHVILDEAHMAVEELAGFLSFSIAERELDDLGIDCPDTEDIQQWRFWVSQNWSGVQVALTTEAVRVAVGRGHIRLDHLKHLQSLSERMAKLKRVRPDYEGKASWVCQLEDQGRKGKRWTFEPVWPGEFSEAALFQHVPHVTLISATLRPKTMSLLGLTKTDYDFWEWPRIFPLHRAPVIHIPTVRMNHRTDDAGLRKWVQRIDEIILSRLDRKGVIHTVSYARQQYLLKYSQFSYLMLGNTSDPNSPTATQVVMQFKNASAPCVLVSPSFSTGWDFPGDECEWCIIAKIPFPPAQSKAMKARMERDPQYLSHLAMQDLVQSAGRGMRSEDDRCETFIIDDSISWFLYHNRTLAPSWFTVRKSAQIPPPPKSLFEESMLRKSPDRSVQSVDKTAQYQIA